MTPTRPASPAARLATLGAGLALHILLLPTLGPHPALARSLETAARLATARLARALALPLGKAVRRRRAA